MFHSLTLLVGSLAVLGQAKRCDLLQRQHRHSQELLQEDQSKSTAYESVPAYVSTAVPNTSEQYSHASKVYANSFDDSAESPSNSASASGAQTTDDAGSETIDEVEGFPNRLYIDFSSVKSGDDAESVLSYALLGTP